MGLGASTSTPTPEPPAQQLTAEELRTRLNGLNITPPRNASLQDLMELWEEANKPKPGLFKQLSMGYDELVGAIIRPPRINYTMESLGRRVFRVEGFGDKEFERLDFDLVNARGHKLVCSWWTPRLGATEDPQPAVIYLHGNSSCRAEALDVISTVLGQECSLLAFDFSGCGISDGEYVSLGFYESQDLKCVVEYLRASGRVSTIGLWGRSMGAVTAIMYVQMDPSIACLILDSPFSSLKNLARDLVDSQQLRVPRFALSIGLRIIRSSIKSRAGFDINALEPIEIVPTCFVPALFGAGEDDDFIPPQVVLHFFFPFGSTNVIFSARSRFTCCICWRQEYRHL